MKKQEKYKIKIFEAKDWLDYELIDTGEGEKLEKFGPYIFSRPYENAFWKKTSGVLQWSKIDGKFWSSATGAKAGWKTNQSVQSSTLHKDKWEMEYKGIKFLASATPFRHLGFFPEQAVHWDFIEEKIKKSGKQVKFLNLFGYTGVSSLFALRVGAKVTHVDASLKSIEWAKENQKLNMDKLEGKSMRIICDDVLKFLAREIKRGNKYDAVIMDPPKFGRGPRGETWNIEKDLPKLLLSVQKVLSDDPIFIIINSYATGISALSLQFSLEDFFSGLAGETSCGELCISEKSQNRIIPLSNTAIWSSL